MHTLNPKLALNPTYRPDIYTHIIVRRVVVARMGDYIQIHTHTHTCMHTYMRTYIHPYINTRGIMAGSMTIPLQNTSTQWFNHHEQVGVP